MRQLVESRNIEVLARGLVVLFPEPMNQKTEAVLISNGIVPGDFSSEPLTAADIVTGTLILTFEASQRERVLQTIDGADETNTYVLSNYVGDEIEVLDPYGAPIQTYGLLYEVLRSSIEKLLLRIQEENGGIEHE